MSGAEPADGTGTVRLLARGSSEYAAATRPANTVTEQRPALVARPLSPAGVAAVVREAGVRGLRVVPQATGHGAGAPVGHESLLLDTSGLDAVEVDPVSRTVRVGAGATWGQVNAAAEPYGLMGLAGSAPGVSVSGYTFGGGFGWLVRPWGSAAASLRRVHYVTGSGERRIAADDAVERLDREAIRAFRGGGGVGIATGLELGLVRVPELWAGYLLFGADVLDAVVTAWARSIPGVGPTVSSTLSVLHLPPSPGFPTALRGRPAVHLAIASSDGDSRARGLLEAVRRAAAPLVDTWGRSDATRLAGIHLDPPAAVPALGLGRWLDDDAVDCAAEALHVALEPGTPLALVELRHVGDVAAAVPGAAVSSPGPFLLHAVGALQPGTRPAIEAALASVRAAVGPADTGRVAAPWMDGAARVPDALPPLERDRVTAVSDAVDPDGVLFRSRLIDRP